MRFASFRNNAVCETALKGRGFSRAVKFHKISPL
jgi:hypothetical protein